MITEAMYKTYFGVTTAPTNIVRLDFLSQEAFKNIMSCDFPAETDTNYESFTNALLEQIKFFDENGDLMSVSGSGYSLGKYSEGSSEKVVTNESIKRISPLAYMILLNLGYLYVGLC